MQGKNGLVIPFLKKIVCTGKHQAGSFIFLALFVCVILHVSICAGPIYSCSSPYKMKLAYFKPWNWAAEIHMPHTVSCLFSFCSVDYKLHVGYLLFGKKIYLLWALFIRKPGFTHFKCCMIRTFQIYTVRTRMLEKYCMYLYAAFKQDDSNKNIIK